MNNEVNDLIGKKSQQLIRLKQRYLLLSEYKQIIEDYVGQKKCFPIVCNLSYDLICRYEDSLVVDLCSWCCGLRKTFFNPLAQDCSTIKKYKYQSTDYPEPSIQYVNFRPTCEEIKAHKKRIKKSYFDKMNNSIKNIFEELFPNVNIRRKKQVNHNDIKGLADSFDQEMLKIKKDRDKFRAHKFEGEDLSGFESIKLSEIGELFVKAEKLINSLCIVMEASSISFTEVNSVFDLANNMAVNVLFGSMERLNVMLTSFDGSDDVEKLNLLKKDYQKFLTIYKCTPKEERRFYVPNADQ